MNIVKIDPNIYEFGEVPQEEYLEYFQYKNPVKVEENIYRVDELGASLPAVEILERDLTVLDKTQEPAEEEWDISDFLEQMDAYRQNFEELIAEMSQARQENERKLNQCYEFLKEKGLMESFEKEYGKEVEVKEGRGYLSGAEQASVLEQEDKTPKQKEPSEKQEEELQNLAEKKTHIVVNGLAGTWQVVMKSLSEPDKKERFVLKSETSAESSLLLVDQFAHPVDEDMGNVLNMYAEVENYRLAQQIVRLIEKQDTILRYEQGYPGWENQMQAIESMIGNVTTKAGRDWIFEIFGYIQSDHPQLAEEIENIKEKMSSLQEERTQAQTDYSPTEEKIPSGEENSRMEEDSEKNKKELSPAALEKEQEKKAEITKKKKLSL